MSSSASVVSSDLKQLASDVLSKALKAGATDAEAVVYEGDEFSALVRLGQVETLKESGSRAVGLRVFLGSGNAQRTASTSSSDFSSESDRSVSSRVPSRSPRSPAKTPSPDCRSATSSASSTAICSSTSTTSTNMPPAERIEIARRTEAAAMAYDTRIQNSRRRRLRHRRPRTRS